jgi:WhiB family transcriptional regulator, redox-sensing transcriptional regulator
MSAVADFSGSTGWMSRGACHGEDPELFFPVGDSYAAQRQAYAAITVCGRCGVRAQCLAYALDSQHEGIWGGTTAQERAAARRRAGARPRALRYG